MLKGKNILVTGGTGSFGREFAKQIFKNHPDVNSLVIFSRDEQKHHQMSIDFEEYGDRKIKFIIGDVRDLSSLERAFVGMDIVIHAAAMKHVHLAEMNPLECIKTNVHGAENVVAAAIRSGVKIVIGLSTDKAAAPNNLYGATKLTSDKLFIASNNLNRTDKIRFSIVRLGNFLGSTGSVIPFFLKKRKEGFLPITDISMTRFNMVLEDACKFVLKSIENSWGGEIFVPKIPSYRLMDLAVAIAPNCNHNIVGMRPGEKQHEEMITISDAKYTLDLGGYFVILPQKPIFDFNEYEDFFKPLQVDKNFSYQSGLNDQWETVDTLRDLIKKYVDPNFIY